MRCPWRGFGVGGLVKIDVLLVVECSDECEGFDTYSGRMEFECVAQVNKRVANCAWLLVLLDRNHSSVGVLRTAGDEIVDQRIPAFKEILEEQFFPVIAEMDKLVLEKIYPRPLVTVTLKSAPAYSV